MKKITKTNFQGLRQLFPVLGKEDMRHYVGGYSNGYWNGNWNNPYSYFDYGGYTGYNGYYYDGSGYRLPEVTVYGYYPNHNQGGGDFWPIFPNGPLENPNGGYPYSNGQQGYNGNPGINGNSGYGYYGYYGYYDTGYYGGGSGGNVSSDDDGNPNLIHLNDGECVVAAIANALTDGVDIGNIRNFTLNLDSQPVFNEQMVNILKSNSVLKALLSYFNNGVIHLTFDLADMNSVAQTTYPSRDSFHITFNEQFMDDEGWSKILRHDNMNYDWSKVHTAEEALVVVLAHESQHANHVARFFDAAQQAHDDPTETANLLKEWGYNQEYVDIFIESRNGKYSYVSGDQQVVNMHDYMDKYNQGVIDAALEEYRQDYSK